MVPIYKLTILLLLVGLFTNSYAQSPVSNNLITTNEKKTEIKTDPVFEKIKKTIQPVELKDEIVVIHYDSIPSPVNIKLGEAITDTNIKNNLIKDFSFEEENIDVLINQAYKAATLGSIEAAISIYKKVLVLDKTNSNALFSIGALYQKLNQYEDAKLMYAKLFNQGNNSPNAINNYLALISQESPSKALIKLQELERINPNYSPVKAQIAMIYAKDGNLENAESYFRKAIMLAPEIINYRYNLAILYDKNNKSAIALQMYRQILDFAGTELPPETIDNIKLRISHLQNSLVN